MISITKFAKSSGPLTKMVSLSDDGLVLSDGSACIMARGSVRRIQLSDLHEFADLIDNLASHEAIALGALRSDLSDDVLITTKTSLQQLNGHAQPNQIARTGEFIEYRALQPALALIDIDRKGMPPSVKTRIDEVGGFRQALRTVLPELAKCGHVIRPSTSTGLYRSDTGQRFQDSGLHVFVLVSDGEDVDRFLRTLHDRCWLAGLGWLMIGAGGQLLERSIVDRMVGAPERLVFEGAPIVVPPLAQDTSLRRPQVRPGGALDTRQACLDLSQVEKAILKELKRHEAHRIKNDAEAAHSRFVNRRAKDIAARTGKSEVEARQIVEKQCGGTLLPGAALEFDADELAGCTVADVLADPEKFDGQTLADPLEGIGYGRCKARIMRRHNGTVWIHSFAHGRTVYELKHDAASVEAAIRSADPKDAAKILVVMLAAAEVPADELERLKWPCTRFRENQSSPPECQNSRGKERARTATHC
jgi:hypothetical protein